MAGLHGVRIYTLGDNDLCPRCINGERIIGDLVFENGGVICHASQIPTSEGCKGFSPRAEESLPPFLLNRR